jgi:hypothetical protein
MKTEELLPCPFCGGKVERQQPRFNLAYAQCTECNTEWGHCGAKYEKQYERFNRRVNKKLEMDAFECKKLWFR